jgi:hypothetical protein
VTRPSAVHFYHLWLGGEWRQIAEEHFDKLRQAEFPGQVFLGLVGDPETRAAARSLFPYEIAVEADAGFEEVTINALRLAVRQLPGTTPVLYSHNKGSFHQLAENHAWRRAMDDHLVLGWQARVRELLTHDVSVWHWLEAGSFPPEKPQLALGADIAGGNFWWARADYLKGLPVLPSLSEDNRISAEVWLGTDKPAVACASREWPRLNLAYQRPKYVNGMLAGYSRSWLRDDGVWEYRL